MRKLLTLLLFLSLSIGIHAEDTIRRCNSDFEYMYDTKTGVLTSLYERGGNADEDRKMDANYGSLKKDSIYTFMRVVNSYNIELFFVYKNKPEECTREFFYGAIKRSHLAYLSFGCRKGSQIYFGGNTWDHWKRQNIRISTANYKYLNYTAKPYSNFTEFRIEREADYLPDSDNLKKDPFYDIIYYCTKYESMYKDAQKTYKDLLDKIHAMGVHAEYREIDNLWSKMVSIRLLHSEIKTLNHYSWE